MIRLKIGSNKCKYYFIGVIVCTIVILLFLLISNKSYGYMCEYTIVTSKLGDAIKYPKLIFTDRKKQDIEKKINDMIESNIYGPYSFLNNEEVATDMDYSISYYDNDIISIVYEGVYVENHRTIGKISFAVTIDLQEPKLISLNDIITSDGILSLKEKMLNKDFLTKYGAIDSEETYIKIQDIIKYQPCFEENDDFYYYLDSENQIGLIIIGLPFYGGSYSKIEFDYDWKAINH